MPNAKHKRSKTKKRATLRTSAQRRRVAQRSVRERLATRSRTALRATFSYFVSNASAFVVLVLVFGAIVVTQAQTSTDEQYLAMPTVCNGWENGGNAQTIDLMSSSGFDAFTSDNAAKIQSRAVNDQQQTDPSLTCSSFALPADYPATRSLNNAQLLLSLGVEGNPDSNDVLVIETSLDGQEWKKQDSFFLTSSTSNAEHGGYWSYSFPLLAREALAGFRVRARFVSVPTDTHVQVLIDGMALAVGARDQHTAPQLTLPQSAATVEKASYQVTESPVVGVEVEKQSRFKFLGVGSTKREVVATTLIDPLGNSIVPDVAVHTQVKGGSTYADYTINTESFTRPGKYKVEFTVKQGDKVGTITQDFQWGVLVINTVKPLYHPGETVQFAMGVLDPSGHTICDADVTLVVTEPFGTKKTFRTADGSVVKQQSCGNDNFTDVPDYTAEYDTSDEGDYSVALTAVTKYGTLTTTDTVHVQAVIPFEIVRRVATRINPNYTYTSAFDVKPQRAFRGVITERVPTTFAISAINNSGYVEKKADVQEIHWLVQQGADETRTYAYRVNFPQVSPELFRIGAITVGTFTEARQWQIASDATGSTSPSRLWMTGFELNTLTAGIEVTGSSGTVAISTSPVRSGTYSLRVNPTTAAANANYSYQTADDATGTYVRAYVRFATLPNSNTQVLSFRDNAATNQSSIRYDNTNAHFELWNEEDNTQIGSDYSTTITTGRWYRVELYTDFGTAATGDTKVAGSIDGKVFASSTTQNWANGIRTVAFGPVTTTTTQDAYFDDVAINADSTNSVAGEGYPGEGKVVRPVLDGNGTNTAWTNTYTNVDEETPSDADFVQASATSQSEDFTFATAASVGIASNDSIKVIQVNERVGNSTASALSHTTGITIGDGTTFNTITSIAFTNAGYLTNNDEASTTNPVQTVDAAGTVTIGQVSYDKPGTTTDPWTAADIDNIQARITSGTDNSPIARVSSVWLYIEYNPAEGGRLWTSGFELGVASPPAAPTAGLEFTSNVGSPEIVTSTKRYGSYAMRTNQTNTTEGGQYTFGTADITDDFYARAYVNFTTRPNSNAKILVFQDNAGTDQASIRFDSANNTLELWNEEDNAQVGSDSTATISAGNWYMIELKIDATTIASTGLAARLDNQVFASGTVDHANGVKTLAWGAITTNTTSDAYWDDMALNEGYGSTQNTYPGTGAVVAMQPDSVGDNTAWAVSVTCDAVDYTCVDEVPPNDVTDAVGSSTLNQVEDNNLESSSSAGIGANDDITLVSAGIRFDSSTAVTTGAKVRLKSASGALPIESDTITAASTTWATNAQSGPITNPITAYSLPNVSTGWTVSDLDAAQVGVRLVNDGTSNFRVTAMWLMVEYIPKIQITAKIYSSNESTGLDCTVESSYGQCLLASSTNGASANISDPSTTTNAATNPISWYANAPQNAGDPVVLYQYDPLGSEYLQTTTVLLASSTSANISTGADLYLNRVSLVNLSGVVTVAKMAAGDNGAVGIRYNVSGTTLTTDSGLELHVSSGYTFTAGGAVNTTSAGFHVASSGTATLDTSGSVIDGAITTDATSTLSINADTTVKGAVTCSNVCNYTSGTPTVTTIGTANINFGSKGAGAGNVYNLNIGDGSTSTASSLVTSSLTVANAITVTNSATLNANQSISVLGGGILTTASGTGNFTYTSGTPTVTMSGTGNIGPSSGSSGSGTIKFYNLTVTSVAATTIRQSMTVDNNFVQSGGGSTTIAYGNTPTVTMACTGGGTCSLGTSNGGTISLYNLTTSGTGTIQQRKDITVNGDLTVGSGTTFSYTGTPTLTMAGSSKSISGTGTKSLYGLTISGSVTWSSGGTNSTAGTFSVSTGGAFTDGADISVAAGLANMGTGTIAYSGTPTITATGSGVIGGSSSGTVQLYKLSVTSGTATIGTASGGVDFDNLVTAATGGTVDVQNNLSVGAGLTTTGTGTITGIQPATTTFTASGSLGGNDSGCAPGTILVAAGTLTQASNCALTGSASVSSGATWSGGTKNLSIVAATFDGNGTVTFTGGTVTIMHSNVWTTGTFGGNTAWTFNNLAFAHNPASYANASTTATGSGGITVNGTLSTESHAAYPACGGSIEDPGTCYITLDAGSKAWNLTGTGSVFINAGRLLGSTSTFNYTNTTSANIGRTTNTSIDYYHDVNFDPSGTGNTPTYTLPLTSFVANGNMVIGDDLNDITLTGSSNNPAVIINGNVSCGNGFNTGNSLITGSGIWTIGGDFDPSACLQTYTTGNTLNMVGSSKTITATGTLYRLIIDPTAGGGGTIFIASSNTVSNTLTVASNDQFTINGGRTLTLTGTTLTLNGTLNGPGRFTYKSLTDFPTSGTLAAGLILRFDTTSGDQVMSERTDYQYVEIENSGSTAGRVVTLATGASQTISIANNLTVQKTGASGDVTLTGATNAPAVNVTGDVSCGVSNTKNLTTGAGTWTVSGNVTLTNCSAYTATSGNTLVMNGTSKTLTSAGFTLQNVTLSGSITLATATHTIAGDFSMAGGTITAGSSTVTMTGSGKTLTGGSQTLNNLTIGTGSGASVALATSDLTVSGTVNVGSTDALTVNSGRTLTHSGATLTLGGTINGPGTLEYRSSTAFPTGGTLAAGLILRFNVTAASESIGARTDYQYVEIENTGTTGSRTVTLGTAGSQTISIANDLTVKSTGTGGVTLTGATNAPAVNVTGNITCTSSANSKAITTGAGVWTVSGNFDMTNCTTLTTTAGNTLAMNGSSTTLTVNGNSLKKLSITGGSITTVDAVTATDTFTIANGATLTQGANVNLILQGDSVSIANGGTFTKASGSGIFILDGVSLAQTFTDSNASKQNLGTVQIGQSPSTTTLASDMSASTLNIHTGDTLNTKGYDVTVTNHVDCQGTCTLDMTDTAPNNEGDGTIMDVGGNWTMSGTLTAYTNSTVLIDGTSGVNAHETITTNGQTFYNFECKNAGTTNDKCIISGNLVVAGDLTLTDGGLDLATNNPTVNTAKNVSIASGAYVSKGTGAWTFDGTTAATYTDSSSGGPQNIGAVTFNKTSGVGANDKVTLASSMTVDTATIATGDTLDLGSSSYTLTLAKAGATATVLTVTGTLTPGTSTVKFTATNSGGNINVPTTTYSSLQFSGAETYDQTGHLTGGNALTGSVTIDTGATLDSTTNNYNIAVSKDWNNAGGTYTARSGTVYLVTANAATVSGSTTFNNFNISGIGAAKVVSFVHGTTQTVGGTWTATGSAGNILTLQRDNTSAWTINPTAATVDYTTVSWSNSGLAICATHSTDGGNNNGNWSFSAGATCGIDVAGTSNSSGGTVRVAVNSTLQAQTTTLAGTWTITGVSVSSGDKVTVFVEGADSAETTGVTKYDGTGNISGMVLDTNVLTAGSDDNASLVLTDFGLYDNDDNENVMHTANSSVLTVDGAASYASEQLTVKASNTLTIGTSETLATYHLSNAGTLVGTGSATFNVFGNWTNSSTFTHNTSAVNFKATDTGHTINNGASSFYNVIFDGSGGAWSPLTNTMTVTNDLTMTNGAFDTSSGTANVTVNGNVQCGASCGTINMTSTNTFKQSVAANKNFGTNVAVGTNWTFYNLTFEKTGGLSRTITFNGTGTGQIIVTNTLATSATVTTLTVDNETNDRILDINGAVNIGNLTTLQASSSAAFTVAGNWTNNGDFTDGSGTVTLDGSSQQTVDGQLTGASDRFYNLTITNASGSDPDSSPSVIFAASADTANTFTAATASTKVRFLAGGAYTFQNINFNGQATGTRVTLRSSSTDTQWALNVAGTRSVTKTDVKDSDACGQAPHIDATDGTNADGGNNTCWDINILTVTLSGASASLGALDTGHVNQAGITSTVTTSASGGYISFVKYDHTLTSGTDTIPDTSGGTIPIGSPEFGAASSQSGNTIAQWSPTACSTTTSTSNATALTTAFQAFASATSVVASDVTTLCFLASISGTTPAGSYSSTATLVTTARF